MFAREAVWVPVAIARQYGTAAGLRRRQVAGLAAMLAHAQAHVPYYRDDPRYDRPLASLADLAAFPRTDKQLLRTRSADLLADGVRPEDCVRFRTSGSTGQRVTVLHDHASHDYHSAALVRRFTATGRGYRPTDRLSHIRPFAPPERRFERYGLFRRHVLLSHRPMPEIAAELVAHRPRVIVGYPVHLRALLRALTPGQLAAVRRDLKMVMTESELLLPEHRAEFARAFGVPVFDEYSAFEVLNVYYECRYGGRHVSADRLVVEVTDEHGVPVPDGTEGEIVVTSFLERAQPLLRYRLGDVGLIEPGRCRCGRRFPRLRLTLGRVNDSVLLPTGRRLYPDAFLHIAATFPGVAECFVHQDGAGRISVAVVPSGDAGPDLPDAVAARVRELAGCPVEVEVRLTDEVAITVGGKGKFVSSELPADATP
jgi:phenylacetate-CoA ligase